MRSVGATTSLSRCRGCRPSGDPWCDRSLPRASEISDKGTPSAEVALELSAPTLSIGLRRITLPARTVGSSSSPCRLRRALPLRAAVVTPAVFTPAVFTPAVFTPSSPPTLPSGVFTLAISPASSPAFPPPTIPAGGPPRGLRSADCRRTSAPTQPSLPPAPSPSVSAPTKWTCPLGAWGSMDRSKKFPCPTSSPRSVQPVGVRSTLAIDGAVTEERRPVDDATLDLRSIS
jgi:hypothetical protein